jgi:spermidine/putrescine transport system permease protein
MSAPTFLRRPNRVLSGYAILFLVALYFPILLIPLFSFNDSIYVRFPMEGFTTEWFVQLWDREAVWESLWASAKVGVAVAILSTILGVLAARAITRYRVPGQGAVVGFIMMPLVIPTIIFGVALLALVSRLGVPLSLYTVAMGHMIVCLPFSVATLLPRFEGFDRSLEQASADLGENGWWTFWRITFPLVLPGIVASLLLTFTISFDEFIVSFFLSGNETTLPVYIWTQLRFPQQFPSVLALASLIILFSLPLILIAMWISRLGLDRKTTTGAET